MGPIGKTVVVERVKNFFWTTFKVKLSDAQALKFYNSLPPEKRLSFERGTMPAEDVINSAKKFCKETGLNVKVVEIGEPNNIKDTIKAGAGRIEKVGVSSMKELGEVAKEMRQGKVIYPASTRMEKKEQLLLSAFQVCRDSKYADVRQDPTFRTLAAAERIEQDPSSLKNVDLRNDLTRQMLAVRSGLDTLYREAEAGTGSFKGTPLYNGYGVMNNDVANRLVELSTAWASMIVAGGHHAVKEDAMAQYLANALAGAEVIEGLRKGGDIKNENVAKITVGNKQILIINNTVPGKEINASAIARAVENLPLVIEVNSSGNITYHFSPKFEGAFPKEFLKGLMLIPFMGTTALVQNPLLGQIGNSLKLTYNFEGLKFTQLCELVSGLNKDGIKFLNARALDWLSLLLSHMEGAPDATKLVLIKLAIALLERLLEGKGKELIGENQAVKRGLSDKKLADVAEKVLRDIEKAGTKPVVEKREIKIIDAKEKIDETADTVEAAKQVGEEEGRGKGKDEEKEQEPEEELIEGPGDIAPYDAETAFLNKVFLVPEREPNAIRTKFLEITWDVASAENSQRLAQLAEKLSDEIHSGFSGLGLSEHAAEVELSIDAGGRINIYLRTTTSLKTNKVAGERISEAIVKTLYENYSGNSIVFRTNDGFQFVEITDRAPLRLRWDAIILDDFVIKNDKPSDQRLMEGLLKRSRKTSEQFPLADFSSRVLYYTVVRPVQPAKASPLKPTPKPLTSKPASPKPVAAPEQQASPMARTMMPHGLTAESEGTTARTAAAKHIRTIQTFMRINENLISNAYKTLADGGIEVKLKKLFNELKGSLGELRKLANNTHLSEDQRKTIQEGIEYINGIENSANSF
jgi:PII-like signaling protein